MIVSAVILIEYSLSTPFDISTATISFSTYITQISDKPHAIEFKPDGQECLLLQMKLVLLVLVLNNLN